MEPEERYTLQGRIGRGSFGEVFRGVDRSTQEIVAIKIIDLDQVRGSGGRGAGGTGLVLDQRCADDHLWCTNRPFQLLTVHRAAGRAAGGG